LLVSTFEIVSQMLSEVCDVDRDKISSSSNIIEDLGVDSLDFLDLTYEIDKKFGVKLPVEDWIEKINQGQAKVSDYFAMDKLVRNIELLAAAR
jgi:acyl carrier protein